MIDPLDDLTGSDYHRAADETNDAAGHDERHAAAVILDSDPIWAVTTPYIARWLRGLADRHAIAANKPC